MIGFDPGLRKTGWGIIDVEGSRLIHVANGIVHSDDRTSLAERLMQLFDGLQQVITDWEPASAAVEETFVNKNPTSTLKLGQARGISLLVPALAGIPVAEYSPNHIKKSVVGAGHAGKEQVAAMLKILLPQAKINGEDAGDALAVAICHAHNGGAHGSLHAALKKDHTATGRGGAQILFKGTR
ncbi:crossover junction endodeoxyribonuclease RuvC [Paremcibacter congregatus]|uniref:Crossover junction endodeoxyribonuclease RuvC n=1 Tax=Paremcibacter congregatus TaxID=2043170 RepID=A0A2G4YTZ7_9PROT|nr:crossover junction endodeoxyribonuclease RuvC [Paremcibacter congregatus]QDE29173.1 crossover junction endodeoxyribonuclease RuvC [Paremcibacter congregatus]